MLRILHTLVNVASSPTTLLCRLSEFSANGCWSFFFLSLFLSFFLCLVLAADKEELNREQEYYATHM